MCFEERCQENVKKRFRDAEHTCPPSALLFLLCAPHLSLRLEKKKNNPACKKKRKKKHTKSPQDKPLLGKTVNQNAPSATQ